MGVGSVRGGGGGGALRYQLVVGVLLVGEWPVPRANKSHR